MATSTPTRPSHRRWSLSAWLGGLALLAIPASGAGQAQPPLAAEFQIPGVTGYDAAVPTPDAVIGGLVGSTHTRPHELVEYVRLVADSSARVTWGAHGETYERRPLVHAIITSPENHARLDGIRRAHLRLSDDPGGVTDEEIAGMPAIVSMGYSVHGNEASGSEAAMLLLHHLAAGQGPAVEAVLRHLVVILDPSLNPDGRARFVNWVRQNRGRVSTSDGQDREHNEPWPGGRTNHYLFDLNRDWLPGAHPESIGRLELFHHWRPQLHTDFHEMSGDATYFFQPGVPERDNPNTPAETIALTGEVARYHARWLDRLGALYYSRETYDDFYYGKGSTYPDVNGAVGILFEQASARSLVTETRWGRLSYAATIRTQFATSLSTLEAGVELRERLLRNHRDHYLGASAFAQAQPVRGWVISLAGDRTRAQALGQMLLRHRIRLYELARPLEAAGQTFQPGEAFVIPLDQPQARLVNGVMERRFEFEDSIFYDVSTWSSALAYGVAHAELDTVPAGLLGAPVEAMAFDGGAVRGGRATYAYLLEWNRYFAPRALYRLQDAGILPAVALRAFDAVVEGERRSFAPGTVIVPVRGRDEAGAPDPDVVHRIVEETAREDHVVFHAIPTGQSAAGIDLGSPNIRPLPRPAVALLSGSGTNAYMVGETWHLLNERMGVPVSLLDVSAVSSADLSRYSVLVMAGYGSGLVPAAAERIEAWVRNGGVLVTLGTTAGWVLSRELLDTTRREVPPETGRIPWADLPDRIGSRVLRGSIFEIDLDTTHPVGLGSPSRVPVFRNHELFLEPSGTLGANVALYTDDPLLSGYLHDSALEGIRRSAAILAERAGAGAVIAFLDNMNFRAFWYGTNGLFLNAVFFGGVL